MLGAQSGKLACQFPNTCETGTPGSCGYGVNYESHGA
jgi:hypothetical protein